ncbi:glycosyltransferase family 4 protein [Kluyvera intermedia]|uniref:glycosyltransferase family 4 protein n=1 Tax=Kluyvera intermedia TaxID=61648 RepID=UPI003525D244
MTKKIINHVFSNNVKSLIFEHILEYHKKYRREHHEVIGSVNPIDNADVYVYHRPHLEKKLMENSIAIVHHDLNEFDPWFHLDKFEPRYREAKYIACLNLTQKRILQERFFTNLKLIPHGYDDNIFKSRLAPKRYRKDKKVCIGIISKYYLRGVKGESSVIEIAKRLPTSHFEFILAGEGRGILNEQLLKFGFKSNHIDFLPYNEYDKIYNEIDFLLVTSFYEGGPANIPEAIATGTPVITTPVGMARDLISNGHNGVVLHGRYDDYAQLIIDSSTEENFNKLSENSLSSKHKILTWNAVIDNYSKIYDEDFT